MFKVYQIKWFFILASILTVSTLLLRPESVSQAKLWEILDYTFKIYFPFAVCWIINGFFIIRNVSIVNKFPKHLLGIVLGILAVFLASYLMYILLPDNYLNGKAVGYVLSEDIQKHFASSFFASLICFVVFYSVHTNDALQNTKLENELLEQAHLRAQLISLQQQISPHFLFNSLSTLKTIATDQPTKNYIIQLSSVYRYVLNFNEQYLTPLKDELSFIRSYLYILNERFEDALQVEIDVDEHCLDLYIPSMSLQLLVENAVKHNMILPESPLRISITCIDKLSLTVENNFQPKKTAAEGTGTGLKNIVERYKLIAGRTIDVSNDGEKFTVNIPLLKK
ncbi:MAG: sensor histidine kinase [Chryseobacterium sp.]|nr:MAG: sensor histidine kinase [Chryseobacterium sp.]